MASTSTTQPIPKKKKPRLSLKLTRKENRHSNTADDEDDERKASAETYEDDQEANDANGYQMFDDPEGPHELPPPYCGLNNLGNTCYFNSVLQALRYTPGFCDGLRNLAEVAETVEVLGDEVDAKQTKQQSQESKKLFHLVIKLNQLFDEMKTREEIFMMQPTPDQEMSVYPEEVLNSVRDLNPMFQGYLQHDSQELLCSLLSKLQEASQKLQQLTKEEKETPKRYKNSKLSLPKNTQEKTAKSDEKEQSETNIVTKTAADEKLKTETKCQNLSEEKSYKSANEAVTSEDAVEKSNGLESPHTTENKTETRITNGKEGSRKRRSSSRDSEADVTNEELEMAPQRKVKKKARMTPSSGSMVKSKADMSGDNCVNGNGDVSSKAGMVNGGGDANGKMSKDSKSNSAKTKSKKRLGVGRLSKAFNQPTILSKFGFAKKDGTPVNGISYKKLNEVNGTENGTEGSQKVANGTSECVETVANGHACLNQTNNNSNQSQPHVPDSSEECTKAKADFKPTETKLSPTSIDDKKSGCHETKVETTPTNRKDKAATNESPEVECIGEVECLGTVSSLDKQLRRVEKMFQGSLVLRTRCMECEGFTERREDFQDISVPVQRMEKTAESDEDEQIPGRPSHLSLSWALSEYACAEKLTADNKYFCESCRHHAEAERTMLFGSLPPVLSVQLKRFCAFAGSLAFGGVSKVNDHLATPLSLCLTQWCTKQCRQRKQKYALYAVVMHSGVSSSSGHYVCYARIPAARLEAVALDEDDVTGVIDAESDAEIWANFDDDRVTVYSDEEFNQVLHPISGSMTTATPYLLFYKSMEVQ